MYGGPREDQTVVAFDTQFRPGWEKVYAYAYSNGGEKSNGNWPGAELVSYGKGVYFYILPSGLEDSMIIFNNGKGEQLPDVPILPEAHMIMNEEGQWAPWVH